MVICLHVPDSWSNWNLEVLIIDKRGKMDYLEKNLSEQGREPTTNSTLIWHQRWDLNSGHMMITHDANSPQVFLTSECTVTTPCEQRLLLSSWVRSRKRGSAWIMLKPWGHCSPNLWTSQSCSLLSNCLFLCVRASINRKFSIKPPGGLIFFKHFWGRGLNREGGLIWFSKMYQREQGFSRTDLWLLGAILL